MRFATKITDVCRRGERKKEEAEGVTQSPLQTLATPTRKTSITRKPSIAQKNTTNTAPTQTASKVTKNKATKKSKSTARGKRGRKPKNKAAAVAAAIGKESENIGVEETSQEESGNVTQEESGNATQDESGNVTQEESGNVTQEESGNVTQEEFSNTTQDQHITHSVSRSTSQQSLITPRRTRIRLTEIPANSPFQAHPRLSPIQAHAGETIGEGVGNITSSTPHLPANNHLNATNSPVTASRALHSLRSTLPATQATTPYATRQRFSNSHPAARTLDDSQLSGSPSFLSPLDFNKPLTKPKWNPGRLLGAQDRLNAQRAAEKEKALKEKINESTATPGAELTPLATTQVPEQSAQAVQDAAPTPRRSFFNPLGSISRFTSLIPSFGMFGRHTETPTHPSTNLSANLPSNLPSNLSANLPSD